MSILSFQTGTAGQASTLPQQVYINTNDTYSTIIAPGYLSGFMQAVGGSIQQPAVFNIGYLSDGDEALPIQGQFNIVNVEGEVVLFGSVIGQSLMAPIEGNVLIAGDSGTIEDCGIPLSDAFLKDNASVVVQNGTALSGNIPQYADSFGTLVDSGFPIDLVGSFTGTLAAGTGSGQAGDPDHCNASFVFVIENTSGTYYIPCFTSN